MSCCCNKSRSKQLERFRLVQKLDTLDLAIKSRREIHMNCTDYGKGKEYRNLFTDIVNAYTKTISIINEELFAEYDVLPVNYNEDIDKEEILDKFDKLVGL